ncbi:MAG TPA: hypothetical protein VLU99_08565 [Nitrososphaerales archaeon]|nr:hypothetical protein [Nitrososphaerales archaeon]HUK75832.1 hypothetical protein [Nitrososphaerales archaeon]
MTGSVAVELLIECSDEEVASALNQALAPDNRYFPKDERFRSSRDGPLIRVDVECPRARPALSTVASVVADAKLFGEIWVEARTKGLGKAPP